MSSTPARLAVAARFPREDRGVRQREEHEVRPQVERAAGDGHELGAAVLLHHLHVLRVQRGHVLGANQQPGQRREEEAVEPAEHTHESLLPFAPALALLGGAGVGAALVVGLLFIGAFQVWLLYVALGLAVISTSEELILLWILPTWRSDVRGLWWVLREQSA